MVNVVFDYERLRVRIKEVLGSQEQYAREIGLGRVSVSQRLNNQLEFTSGEILKSARVLKFPPEDIPLYFFTVKVQKHEHLTKE